VAFAVVFPGQGSQSVGMLADLSERYDAVKTTFAEAADHLDVDLWHLAQTGPAEKLSDTRITQPLMFTAGVAVWRCLQAEGLAMPSAFAGHSLGELGMDDDAVHDLCMSISGERISEAVNFNAPGQVAISGHLDALEKTLAAAKEQGCRKAMMLAVSVPNHSSLMQPAGHELATVIDSMDFTMPAVPLLQNATAEAPADLASA